MKLDVIEKVMTIHKAHYLFVIDRFHLLPEAKKPIQALIGQSSGKL
jgi:hypothetical protein